MSLIKDPEGDVFSSSNYRGLTLSVLFSNMFERALLLKFAQFLGTDYLQFGFKPHHSTSHAIFVMKNVINQFCTNGSNVFCAFLDCTKGFDKVNHNGIFIELMNKNVPLCFLNIMIYWYSNLTSQCKWKKAISQSFRVLSGVRQGGVLSPYIFSIYLDDLVKRLRNSGIGCHLINMFLAAILYADDLTLLAPCRSALQTLLDICANYGDEWCLSFNSKKTKIMTFGPKIVFAPLHLKGEPIDVVDTWKYLGTNLLAHKAFICKINNPLCSFFRATNTVLNAQKKPSEQVLLSLLYSNCIPILTYACDVIEYSSKEMTKANTAINNCIRRIFSYQRWESTRDLRILFGYKSIYEIFHVRQKSFAQNISKTNNPILLSIRANFS